MITLHCPKCRTAKPQTDFHKSRASSTGHQTYCIPCQREATREYVKAHRARKKTQHPSTPGEHHE